MMFESCRSHITIGGSKGAAVHWTLWPNSLCWDHSDVIGGKRRNAGFWVIQDVIMSIFPRTFVDLFWQNEAVTWVFLLFFWLYHAGKKLFTSPRGLGILATYLQVGSVFGEQFLGPWSWIHKTKKGVAICFLSGVCVCVCVCFRSLGVFSSLIGFIQETKTGALVFLCFHQFHPIPNVNCLLDLRHFIPWRRLVPLSR